MPFLLILTETRQYVIILFAGGQLTWEGLGNAALDAFLASSAIAFISSGINYIQYLSRSTPATTAELAGEANNQTAVIGKMQDLKKYKLQPGEYRVADLMSDLGTPKANWKQNSSILRKIMQNGRPIRDISVLNGQLVQNSGILSLERYILLSHGWKFSNGFWILGG